MLAPGAAGGPPRLTLAVDIWTKYTSASRQLLEIKKSQFGMIDDGMTRVLSRFPGPPSNSRPLLADIRQAQVDWLNTPAVQDVFEK